MKKQILLSAIISLCTLNIVFAGDNRLGSVIISIADNTTPSNFSQLSKIKNVAQIQCLTPINVPSNTDQQDLLKRTIYNYRENNIIVRASEHGAQLALNQLFSPQAKKPTFIIIKNPIIAPYKRPWKNLFTLFLDTSAPLSLFSQPGEGNKPIINSILISSSQKKTDDNALLLAQLLYLHCQDTSILMTKNDIDTEKVISNLLDVNTNTTHIDTFVIRKATWESIKANKNFQAIQTIITRNQLIVCGNYLFKVLFLSFVTSMIYCYVKKN